MFQKPDYFASKHAEVFQHHSIVEAYQHRPPYSAEVFAILAELIHETPRRVLDIGCGTGNIARNLSERVESVDAVDFSQPMIEQGKHLPNGDHPHLRWLYGRVEEVELNPPYALVTAGESLHWMNWSIVLPRFHELLTPGGYLAIVEQETRPDPWSLLSEIIPHYTTNKGYYPYDMIEALEHQKLFHKVGEKKTAPILFTQPIDDYIESYHSRSGFSRERMGAEQAHVFDQEAKKILLNTYQNGVIELQVVGSIVWGTPEIL
jgi:ubiquinone/menaquinone biosynthesis C-methylase UbiE